ncbi:MAG: hypothetical protein AAF572_17340 [Cyanobacteria bacterium P01_B01_bin.77]
MKKASPIIHPITKPIRRVGNWCLHVWDGVSGKDYRRLKKLRRELVISQENATILTQQLDQTKAQCSDLQKAFSEQQRELHAQQKALDAGQQELEDSRQEYNELWAELDEWVTESDSQIQSLKRELSNHKAALANYEANFNTLQQSAWGTEVNANTSESIPETLPTPALTDWKIAFVGGHTATRRVAIETLQTEHGLVHTPVQIPPHREERSSQKQLKQKLADCDLIVSIVGYSNHSLTKSLMQLKDKDALKGTILIPNSRGVSGVVREILSFVADCSTPDTETGE